MSKWKLQETSSLSDLRDIYAGQRRRSLGTTKFNFDRRFFCLRNRHLIIGNGDANSSSGSGSNEWSKWPLRCQRTEVWHYLNFQHLFPVYRVPRKPGTAHPCTEQRYFVISHTGKQRSVNQATSNDFLFCTFTIDAVFFLNLPAKWEINCIKRQRYVLWSRVITFLEHNAIMQCLYWLMYNLILLLNWTRGVVKQPNTNGRGRHNN